MLGRLRRAPAPLLALLAVCLVEALTWCIVLPPLQGPDEVSHVAYVQKLADARQMPWAPRGHAPDARPAYSTEILAASGDAAIAPLYGNLAARPAGTQLEERLWAARERGLDRADRADGGFTSALSNPPAYYLYEAVPYLATSPAGLFDQLFVMRLANIPLLLAIVGFAWLIAGELLGRRRWLQTLATGAVALQPQLSNVTATVNPDVFLAAIWSAAVYLMIVILKRGPTRPRTAALVALCVLSGFTHGRGVALVVPALLTLGLAVWKARRPGRRLGGRSALALMGLGAIVTAPVFVLVALDGRITSVGVRQFASYLWQFYLPRLQSMTPLATDYGFRDVMVERFYGGFARLEINFSAALNDALWTALIAVALSAAVALALERRVLRERWDVVAMLVASVAATMALLHAVAYRTITTGGGDPVITGRYLLPLVTLYGVAVALAVHWLPRRLGVAVGGAVLAGLTLLQLGALGITVERFYA